MTAAPSPVQPDYVRRHLRLGFWALALFLTLGATLEALHGFKVGFYLDVSNETRRLMWTLAHAHGALLGLINVVVGIALRAVPELAGDGRTGLASVMLAAATVLLPAGFFAGGLAFYSGDPGIGIALVPPGAACLLIAVVQLARASAQCGSRPDQRKPGART